jgi:hypothetical protein
MNLVLVFDRSGPVLEECLPGLKGAVRDLIDQLHPDDSLSLVTFGGQVVIPAQMATNPTALKRLLDHLTTGEEAHGSAGLAEGLRQAQTLAASGRVNRLVLLLGNETQQDPHHFYALADQAAEMKMTIIAVGVGSAWSESFLAELASRSLGASGTQTGQVEHIPTPEDVVLLASYVFSSLPVLTQEIDLNLLIPRGIEVQHLWQVRPRIVEWKDLVFKGAACNLPLRELPAEGLAYLIVAMVPPRAPGVARVVQTNLSYTLPGAEVVHVTDNLAATFSPDTGGTNPLNTYVMDYVEATQAYHLNLEALSDLRAGNRKAASQKLRQAAAILTSQGRTALADRIRGEADYNIRQYGQVSNEGRKLILLASQHTAVPD